MTALDWWLLTINCPSGTNCPTAQKQLVLAKKANCQLVLASSFTTKQYGR
jgi:hypothetical protein